MNFDKKTFFLLMAAVLALASCGKDENRQVIRRNDTPPNSGSPFSPGFFPRPDTVPNTTDVSQRVPLVVHLQASASEGVAPFAATFTPEFSSGSLEAGDEDFWTINGVSVAAEGQLQYTFETPGQYTVAYLVRQPSGSSSSASVSISVTSAGLPQTGTGSGSGNSNLPPATPPVTNATLEISPSVTSGAGPLEVLFTSRFSHPVTVRNYRWSVREHSSVSAGLPLSETSDSMKHLFTLAGKYKTTLVAELADGNRLTDDVDIEVTASAPAPAPAPTIGTPPPPSAPNFRIDAFVESPNPLIVILDAVDTLPNAASAYLYNWELREPSLQAPIVFDEQKKVINMPVAGVYEVSLRVTDTTSGLFQTVHHTMDLSSYRTLPPITGNSPRGPFTVSDPNLNPADLPLAGDFNLPPATPPANPTFTPFRPTIAQNSLRPNSSDLVYSPPSTPLPSASTPPMDLTRTIAFPGRNLAHPILGFQQAFTGSSVTFRKKEGVNCENFINTTVVIQARSNHWENGALNGVRFALYSCDQNRSSCTLETDQLTFTTTDCPENFSPYTCSLSFQIRKDFDCRVSQDVARKPIYEIRITDETSAQQCTTNAQCPFSSPHCVINECKSVYPEVYLRVNTPSELNN